MREAPRLHPKKGDGDGGVGATQSFDLRRPTAVRY